ncbi:MAG: dephospho-CoA kinase [Lachnospiraceae bacterium]|nr:dephospho-CoA kinase [Lachnospiraceae bacterium]
MHIIGITGGVGAGKSTVLNFLEDHFPCLVVYADDLAADLQSKDGACYEALRELLGDDAYTAEGELDRKKVAERMFQNEHLKEEMEAIIHPAVKNEIRRMIGQAKEKGTIPLFFIEAALLIEDHYEEICDELWYVYADPSVRRQRLKDSRGYSDEKIDRIFASQLADEVFRAHCKVVIDNSHTEQEACMQVCEVLEGYLWQK